MEKTKIILFEDLSKENNIENFSFLFSYIANQKKNKILYINLDPFNNLWKDLKLNYKKISTKNLEDPMCLYNYDDNLKILFLYNPVKVFADPLEQIQKSILNIADKINELVNLFDILVINKCKQFDSINKIINNNITHHISLINSEEKDINDFYIFFSNEKLMHYKNNKIIILYNYDMNKINSLNLLVSLNKINTNKFKIFKTKRNIYNNIISNFSKLEQWTTDYIEIETLIKYINK